MEKTKKKSKLSGFWKGLKVVFFSLFTLFAVVSITATIVSKKSNDDAVSVFNHEMRLVLSDSMDKDPATDVSDYKIKSIPKNTLVFVEEVPNKPAQTYDWYQDIKVGDVLVFKYKYDRQVTLTHRVINITPIIDGDKQGFVFALQGDNRGSTTSPGIQIIDTTEENSFNYIIGKVIKCSTFLGAILGFVTSKSMVYFAILLIGTTLLIYELINIVRILKENKSEKIEKETVDLAKINDEQKQEIERLKQELETLKKQQITT